MGVHGLWRLLEPSGRPVAVDSLRGRVLAVDISIWLHSSVKGLRDGKGAAVANAHLLTLFRRLCKLLHCGVKPVFVFDGAFPPLKKRTVIERQTKRRTARADADGLRRRLLEIVSKRAKATASNQPTTAALKTVDDEELFKLPPKPEKDASEESGDDEPSQPLPKLPRYDLHTLDVNSDQFRKLSARQRHDALTELKETRKESSWGRINEIPKQSDNFSDYQMKRLLKRRQIQTCLEETEKEIGGSHLTLNDLETLLNEEGIDTKIENIPSKRIASDESSHYVLIKDIKGALRDAASKATSLEKETNELSTQNVTETLGNEFANELKEAITLSLQDSKSKADVESSSEEKKESMLADKHSEVLQEESDEELKKAIALSLDNSESNISSHQNKMNPSTTDNIAMERPSSSIKSDDCRLESSNITLSSDESDDDDNYDRSEPIASNRSLCLDAAKGYLLEFGGLTEYGIKDIFETKANQSSLTKQKRSKNEDSKVKEVLEVDSSSDSDSDFEEVPDGNAKPVSNETDIFSNVFNDVSKFKDLENAIIENVKKSRVEPGKAQPSLLSIEHQIPPVEPDKEVSESDPNNEWESLKKEVIEEVCKSIGLEVKPGTSIETISQMINSTEILSKIMSNEIIEVEKSEETPKASDLLEERPPPPPPVISTDEMIAFVDDIEHQSEILESERNKLDRMGRNITDEMAKDAQFLLKLFGIPYLIAPTEAEAQCAFLESIKLTDGTITDDSDIWLFGGQTVYRNFFNQQKHVLQFLSENIQKSFRLQREDFILLALLVGSDYTMGISGIGPVTALEILAAFPPNKTDLKPPYDKLLDGLKNFKSWLSSDRSFCHTSLRKKLKNISLSEEFPNHKIVEAYLLPDIEKSEELFSWGVPDVISLREYAKEKFGWSRDKTAEILMPVMKRLNTSTSQLTVDSFFKVQFHVDSTTEKLSKRVKKAVDNIGKEKSDDNTETDVKKTKRVGKKLNEKDETDKDENFKEKKSKSKKKQTVDDRADSADSIVHPSTSSDVIPQREVDKNLLLQNKLKAIEVFRKSVKGPGYTKRRKKVIIQLKDDANLSESGSSD